MVNDHDLPPFTVVAYNKGLTVGTVVNTAGNPDPGPGEPGYSPFGQRAQSKLLTQYALDNLNNASAAHHVFSPATVSAAQSVNRDQLDGLLKVSTFYLGMTHGGPDTICDSANGSEYYDNLQNPLYGTHWLHTYAITNRPAGTPPFNLVLNYACSTLETATDAIAQSYGLLCNPDGSARMDTAYTGVNDVLMLKLVDTSGLPNNKWENPVKYEDCDMGISEHTKIVGQYLLDGHTIKEAVDAANRHYLPRHAVQGQPVMAVSLKMQVVGDPYARLINVYQNQAEIGQYGPKNTWYFFL